MRIFDRLFLAALCWPSTVAFTVPQTNPSSSNGFQLQRYTTQVQRDATNSKDDDQSTNGNPYNDPTYPDLEFIDYSDPNYNVDQGVTEEYFAGTTGAITARALSTEEAIETMREERRRLNDEYQFQTYYADILKGGDEYLGEWTVYTTNSFLSTEEERPTTRDAPPRLFRSDRRLKMISRGFKTSVPTNSTYAVDSERIVHEEKVQLEDVDTTTIMSGWDDEIDSDNVRELGSIQFSSYATSSRPSELEILNSTYWPSELQARDFRGDRGIMKCGNSWTGCLAIPLCTAEQGADLDHGPFGEYRAELGLQHENIRMRVRLDYTVKQDTKNDQLPPLHLKSIVVCRETKNMWPHPKDNDAFLGELGADGGLYDPPPVGPIEQAQRYMLLDLRGRATLLFPYVIDQDSTLYDGSGWVTSLDWAPGDMRYQVDRKVNSGVALKVLRSLELSEVLSVDANKYRPRDGGKDMRQ